MKTVHHSNASLLSMRFINQPQCTGVLQSFTGSESLSSPFFYVLRFYILEDCNRQNLLGCPVSWQISFANQEAQHFNGIVAKFNKVQHWDDSGLFEIEVIPWFLCLEDQSDCRVFHQKSVIDIVNIICKENGSNGVRCSRN